MALAIRKLEGAALAGALPGVAALRIAVFRDWPYLYDGDLAYEESYLARYLDTQQAVVVGAFDGDRLVGAATAMPLLTHEAEFARAFEGSGVDPHGVFYCAESVLLPDYRGQGAGHAFFDAREAAAQAEGYPQVAFCAVRRSADHPARPAGYRPLDTFWRGRGYTPLPGVTAHFSWRDIGDAAETVKPLDFWIRTL